MAQDQEKAAFFELITVLKIEKGISYLDAILLYCETNNLEIAVAAELTNSALKIKLEEDATELNLLKKQRKLF